MSSAYAQVSQAPREERRIWIILSGPGQRQIPEVNVMAYSGSTGQLLINSLVFTKFSIVVPSEVNQIEISRRGYRSVSFKLTPTIENAVYQIPLEEVSFFSAANFLGPREISVRENVELTQLLSGAVRFCQQGNSEAAAKLATQAELRREKLERDTRRLVCL